MAATPFPFFYNPTYAYTSATAYLPPASGFPPASTFSYPSFPYGTTHCTPDLDSFPYESSCLTSKATSVSTNFEPNWPQHAQDQIPSILFPAPTHGVLPSPAHAISQPGPSPSMASSPSPFPFSSTTFTIPYTDASAALVCAQSHVLDPRTQQNNGLSSKVSFASAKRSSSEPSSPASASDLPVPAGLNKFALQLKVAHRSLLDISRQLDEYQDQSKRSFASLQSGISRLVDMVPSSKSSTTTAWTQSVGFTPFAASISIDESATSVLSNIGAAEISPASSSSSSFGGSFVVPKPASVLTVPASHANVAPRVLDEMPECYGLHNLNRHSLFRADGTEHNYFTLPADYPLERDIPEPLFVVYDDKPNGCSNEFVHVFTSTSEQQSYEEEQQDSGQLLKCVVNAPETEQTIAYLNTTLDVQVFSLELQQQDDERAYSCSDLKASDSVVTRSSQLNIEHSIRGLRLLWDPGDIVGVLHASILTEKTSNHLTKCNTLKYLLQSADIRYPCILSYFFILRYCSVKCNSWLNTVLRSICDHVEGLYTLSLIKPWDPGASAHLQSNKGSVVIILQQLREPQLNVLVTHERRKEWDPGILNEIDMMLDKSAVPNLVHSGLTKFKPSIFVGQPIDLKHFWAQLLLPSHSWYNTPNAFLEKKSCLQCVCQLLIMCT